MKLRPLGERVLVRPIEKDQKPESLIKIPDSAKPEPMTGEVVAVGKSCFPDEIDQIVSGDIVMYGKYAGEDVEVDGEKLKMLQLVDVIAVVEK